MKNKSIVVIVDICAPNGGAFSAARRSVERYREVFKEVFFICSSGKIEDCNKCGIIRIYHRNDIDRFVKNNQFEIIHYFKSAKQFNKNHLFRRILNSVKRHNKNVNVLTTICQQPSNGKTILTPFEIKMSDKLLFIDKTAYNDPLYSFIPLNNKDWFYLYNPNSSEFRYHHLVKNDYSTKNLIVFGRGSTLNKCPKDTIEIFDRINTNIPKKFVIVGVPNSKNWLLDQINKHKVGNIVTYPIMPMDNYMEIISKVDVFLYYLPTNIYSSLDGSLLSVLRLGIPVVVYGPSAPKECIDHGVNGFIANTKSEFIEYAELLALDPILRQKIGNAAKLSTFNDKGSNYPDKQIEIISNILEGKNNNEVKINIKYYLIIYMKKLFAEITYLYHKLLSIKYFV